MLLFFKNAIFLTAISLAIVGCVEPITPFISGGISTITFWKNGEGRKYYALSKDNVKRSIKNALNDLNIPINDNKSTEDKIFAGHNDRFKITISSKEENITLLTIRINWLGDKEYAELIFNKVETQSNVFKFPN